MPGDLKGFDLCGSHANLVMTVVVPSLSRGGLGWGWVGGGADAYSETRPHPNLPPEGEGETPAATGGWGFIGPFKGFTQ